MVKRLTKSGDGLALVLDPPLLEAARIDAETQLEISTDGDVIIISPIRDDVRKERLRAATESVNSRYAGVFRRLAE